MPTPKFVCGAECGITTAGTAGPSEEHWSFVAGAAAISSATAPAARGGKAWRFNAAAAQVQFTHAYVTSVASPATLVARFYVYFATLPAANCRILNFAPAVAPGLNVIFNQSDSTLRAGGNTASLVAASGATVTTGVWYRVDVKGVMGTTRTCDIQVDGVAQAQYSLGGQANQASSGFSLGAIDSATADLYIDDVVVSGTSGDYPIGAGRVTALYPTADHCGTQTHVYNANNDFLDGGTAQAVLALPSTAETDTWQSLQNPLSTTIDNAKFVSAVNAATTEFLVWSFENLPANADQIHGMMVASTHHAASATANAQSMNLVNGAGATDTVYNALDFSDITIITATSVRLKATDGVTDWTVALVNALGAQWWSTDVTPDAYLDGVCLEVAYTETAGGASTNAPAGNAAGTGAANGPAASIKPNAGNAAGTGAAQAPAASIKPNAGNAAGIGAALAPTVSVKVNAGNAAGVGAALQPTVVAAAATSAPAGVAAGTGAALGPSVSIAVNAGNAAGTGTALQPTVLAVAATSAPAGLAAGTGAALAPSASVKASAGQASGIGQALAPTIGLRVNAGAAAGTGTALQPTVSTAVATSAPAGVAAGTGAALGPAVSIRVNAGNAAGTGTALQPTVLAVAATSAPAGNAAGAGSALGPTVSIKPNAGLAAGTGTAQQPTVSVKVNAGNAAGTGVAHQPTVLAQPNVNAPAGVAAGTGAAQQPTVSIKVNAGNAAGTGTALDATATGLSVPVGGFGTAILQVTGQRAHLIPPAATLGAWYFETPGDIEHWQDDNLYGQFSAVQSFDFGVGSLKVTQLTTGGETAYPYSPYAGPTTRAYPGIVHTLRFRVRAATPSRTVQLGLVWLSAPGVEVSRNYSALMNITPGVWNEVSFAAVAPPGTVFVCIQAVYADLVAAAAPVGEVFYIELAEVAIPTAPTGATIVEDETDAQLIDQGIPAALILVGAGAPESNVLGGD